jgi:UDP:flavonoid glycosyltransferase YjiC (YdhE family)
LVFAVLACPATSIHSPRSLGLVLDALWRNLDLVAMKMGVPYVHLSAYFIYDWPYDPSPEGIARNLRGLEEFFPGDHWPPQFHYAGRFPVPFPWERLTGEPLIYASMGTMLNGSEHAFRMIVDAASGPDRQLVWNKPSGLQPTHPFTARTTKYFLSYQQPNLQATRQPEFRVLS